MILLLTIIVIGSCSSCVAKASINKQKTSSEKKIVPNTKTDEKNDNSLLTVRCKNCLINASFNFSWIFVFHSLFINKFFPKYYFYIFINDIRPNNNDKIVLTCNNKENVFKCNNETIIHILGFKGDINYYGNTDTGELVKLMQNQTDTEVRIRELQ